MGFQPFAQFLPLTGGTITGPLTINPGGLTITGGTGSVDMTTNGGGLRVKEGANAKQGTAVLVAGTVTVPNLNVTGNSRVFLTAQIVAGTQGVLSLGAVTPGTSFVINSSNAADTSTVAYEIFEPG